MTAGFVDIQVNGYGGVNYHDDNVTPEQLHASCLKLQSDGAAGILATITSAAPDRIIHRIQNLVRHRAADPLAQKLIWGVHIEGPFMSGVDGYRGAHPIDAMCPVDMNIVEKFHDACDGLLRIFTLAPEQDPGSKATAWLSRRGITVSGGHSNATLDQLDAAIDAGLSMWTHLGNGCPMQMHRHDNIIQRVLSRSDKLWCCFIGDGTHVPLFALKNYFKAANFDRIIITTDGNAFAGMGPGHYRHGEFEFDVGEDLICWAPDKSFFVGSLATMKRCADNLAKIGLTQSQIAALTIHHPAQIAKPQ